MKTLLFSLLALLFAATLQADSAFEENENCIGYRVQKNMFFMDTEVIGKGCEPQIQVEVNEDQTQFRVKVEQLYSGFDSGMSGRDEHMGEIMEIPAAGKVSFQSDWIDNSWASQAKNGQQMELSGHISAGKVHSPAVFQVRLKQSPNGWLLSGKHSTSLPKLKLTIPEVGPFGMIADVYPDFELLVHLQLRGNKDLELLLERPVTQEE